MLRQRNGRCGQDTAYGEIDVSGGAKVCQWSGGAVPMISKAQVMALAASDDASPTETIDPETGELSS
jgi:hypothetical protein